MELRFTQDRTLAKFCFLGEGMVPSLVKFEAKREELQDPVAEKGFAW